MPMDRDKYKDYVLTRLGSPVVDVETNNLISDIVDQAFDEVKMYITITNIETLNYSSKMNLEELMEREVSAVVALYRATRPINLTDPDQLLFANIGVMRGGNQRIYTRYAQDLLIRQLKQQFSKDLDFRYEKPYLYVHQNPPISSSITIEYIPDYQDIEEVEDPFWQNIIRRMALGLTKETLGRVRGKYRLNNAPYELDGDTLLQEGREEVERLREKLEENSDLMFPVD